ncbi:MAG: glycosyltransferase family 1 protein [Methanomassiliicoccales archaeon]
MGDGMSVTPLRILYDHQIFTKQTFGGVSRYYVELIGRYERQPDMEVALSVGDVRTRDLRATRTYQQQAVESGHLKRKVIDTTRARTGVDMLYRSNQRISQRALEKGQFDVFQPTYYDPYFLKALGEKPYYLVIYDMIHELFPQCFQKDSRIPRWKQELVDTADAIVTISENTRKDVIRMLKVDPSKVMTVYLGNSLEPQLSRPEDVPVGLPKDFILFVGAREIYKNFGPFAEAMAQLMKEDRELHLVCVGGGRFKASEDLLLKQLLIGERTHQMDLSDQSLCQTYMRAKAFVFPSLYEGFGLPVVEAFACGCPAVLSNTSSLPEIGGEAAAYFDPTDEGSIAKAVESVILDEDRRQKMIGEGLERAKTFDWDRTADQTKEIYLGLAGRL